MTASHNHHGNSFSGCVAASSPFASAIASARTKFNAASLHGSISDSQHSCANQGRWLLDFIHGQTGVAPNGFELHPVLDVNFTNHTSTDLVSSPNPSSLGSRWRSRQPSATLPTDQPATLLSLRAESPSAALLSIRPHGHTHYNRLIVGSHSLTASYEAIPNQRQAHRRNWYRS